MGNIFKKIFGKDKDIKIQDVNKEEVNIEQVNIEELDSNEIIKEVIKEVIENIDETFETNVIEDEIIEVDNQDNVYNEKVEIPLEFVEKPKGLFSKLKQGLSKTSNGIKDKVNSVLANFRKIDEELFEELEEMLIISDIGIQTTQKIIENIKEKVKLKNIQDPNQIKTLLKEEVKEILSDNDSDLHLESSPSIVLVVGVNGAGKTTSIGKMANEFKTNGKTVLIAAADTFRAAAIDQLEIWSNRVGVDIIKHSEGSDPSAVIFDAISSAKSKQIDVLICDTAGRLHNKKNLMNELAKIQKIIDRELPDSAKEILLVVDATTGQNAVSQAKIFSETTNISGIILTKLDGSAKGGIILTIKSELNIPIKYIGVGEGLHDLQKFNAGDFVNALFEE